MVLSQNINKYVENSKIRGRLSRWNKPVIFVHTTQITAPTDNKMFLYSQITRAINEWNSILTTQGISIHFQEISTPEQADIIIHWVKVGRTYEGMCKYLSVVNGVINKISIDVGLPNEYSGKETTDLSIYCTILHEFGHALGLGHGVEIDDIMYVPHQKNISTPSENDLYVLKTIYS